MNVRKCLILVSSLLMAIPGLSEVALADSSAIVVKDAWARASIGVSRPGAAYMTILNTGQETVVLNGLSSDIAKKPSIHQTKTDSRGVSSMVPVSSVGIGPSQTLTLGPGSLHVMLMGLRASLNQGAEFSLTILFEDGGKKTVTVPILGIAARGPKD